MDLRVLEVRSKVHNISSAQIECRRGIGVDDLREYRSCHATQHGRRVIKEEIRLRPSRARAGEGTENGGVDDAAVVEAPAAADNGFAITGGAPRKACTGTDVVLIIGQLARLRK